jgi:hypothetical protein
MSNLDVRRSSRPASRLGLARVAGVFGAALDDVKLPAVLAVLYFAAVWIYLGVDGEQMLLHLLKSIVGILLFWIIAAAVLRFIHYVRASRPHRPIVTLISETVAALRNLETVASVTTMLLLMSLVCGAFWIMKAHLGDFSASGWDVRLTEIDRMLHGGKLPWEWLQPLVGYWPVTIILNINYQLWLLVMWMMALHFLFAEAARPVRMRFLISFILAWVLCGSVLAQLFLSAGPCYFDRLAITPNPYAPLMDYLHAIHRDVAPLPALWTQDLLWNGYIGKAAPLGISAMPSLHNAIALLNVLAAWSFSRKIAWVLAAHAALVFVGSVHLGWHYAVDAYVGWVVVVILWVGTGVLMRRVGTARLPLAGLMKPGQR